MNEKKERDEQGRFVNYRGPGRPPRPVEREYLEVLYDVATLDKWREAVTKRVQKAIDGDDTAFEWLERYLLGNGERLTLLELAMRERLGVTADAELDFKVAEATNVIRHEAESDVMSKIMEKMSNSWEEKPYLLLLREFAAGRQNGGDGEEKSGG